MPTTGTQNLFKIDLLQAVGNTLTRRLREYTATSKGLEDPFNYTPEEHALLQAWVLQISKEFADLAKIKHFDKQ